jgi:hypothetical protein
VPKRVGYDAGLMAGLVCMTAGVGDFGLAAGLGHATQGIGSRVLG